MVLNIILKCQIFLLKVEQYYKPDEEEKVKIYIGAISKFVLSHSFRCKYQFFAVPEKFYGSGNIRIKGVKQVQVTNDYSSLDLQTRGCQNEQYFEDCVTELYLDLLNKTCKCLPFHLQNFSKQNEIIEVYFIDGTIKLL